MIIKTLDNVEINPKIVVAIKSDKTKKEQKELISKALELLELNINSIPVTEIGKDISIIFSCHFEEKKELSTEIKSMYHRQYLTNKRF